MRFLGHTEAGPGIYFMPKEKTEGLPMARELSADIDLFILKADAVKKEVTATIVRTSRVRGWCGIELSQLCDAVAKKTGKDFYEVERIVKEMVGARLAEIYQRGGFLGFLNKQIVYLTNYTIKVIWASQMTAMIDH